MKRFTGAVVLALLVSLAPALPAMAANDVVVTVKERGGVVPGAAVVFQQADGTVYRRTTNKDGEAGFASIPDGEYTLIATYRGFQEYRKTVTVNDDSNMFDVMMTMVEFSDSVTITTANRREELLRNVAEPTTVISEAAIDDTGGRSAKNVLQDQVGNGIFVEEGGGQGHVSINGISNSGVLILIDGRRWLGKNGVGDVDLEDLDMSRFERIEVIKGAGSALYGSDALGGVINFISKKPDYRGVTNDVEVVYGSYDDIKVSDSLTFLNGPLSGNISASYRTYDGYDLDEDDPQTQGLPESQHTNLGGNLAYNVNDRITLKGYGDFQRREIDNYFFTGATQLGSVVYNSQREITRYTFSPEAEVVVTDSTFLNLRYTHSKYNREETRVFPTFTNELSPWQEWNDQFEATARQIWNLAGQDSVLQAGYEFRNERMDRVNLIFPGTNDSEVERDINVFWAQNEFNLTENLSFTAGFRYDDYSDFGNEFSPKVSAMYAINDENRLRASYGHGFRAPSFGELYLDLGFFFKGNPDLEPETSDNVTVGYTYTGPLASGSFDFFNNKIKNGIVFDLSSFPFTYRNEREFTARGINSEISLNLPGGFTPTIAYTYVNREDEDGEEILGFSKHNGYFKLLYKNPRLGVRGNIRAQFNDQLEFSDGTSRPAYTIWGAQVDKNLFTTGRYDVSAFFHIENITDEDDIVARDPRGNPIPGDLQVWLPPRTFLFGITINMDFIQ